MAKKKNTIEKIGEYMSLSIDDLKIQKEGTERLIKYNKTRGPSGERAVKDFEKRKKQIDKALKVRSKAKKEKGAWYSTKHKAEILGKTYYFHSEIMDNKRISKECSSLSRRGFDATVVNIDQFGKKAIFVKKRRKKKQQNKKG